jgi:class 3 adenylate cyclase
VLFADISGFSARTLNLTPAETLAFVQTFFAWITAEALHGRPGVVDKYIGDELIVVFSTEFGWADPVADAIGAAMDMSRRDVHAYRPHIGIAAGPVIVGQTGTPLRFNVSVYGAPVAVAARCAGVPPAAAGADVWSSIVMPDDAWGSRSMADFLGEEQYPQFELLEPRPVQLKGVGDIGVREIHNTSYRGGASAPEHEHDALSTSFAGTTATGRNRLGTAPCPRLAPARDPLRACCTPTSSCRARAACWWCPSR